MELDQIPPNADEIVAIKHGRALDENALRTVFLEARTANGFLDRPVDDELIVRALELATLGPTSANSQPGRFVIVRSAEAKERLKPALSPGNLAKTMAAPATAIVAADLQFYENFARTFPQRPEMRDRFAGDDKVATTRAFAWDNALLECAYLIVALRAVGLDAGPMGGFDRVIADAAFFPDGRWTSQYLVNIGYGDDTKTFARLPRLRVDEIARFV